jgi:hypothetical protein
VAKPSGGIKYSRPKLAQGVGFVPVVYMEKDSVRKFEDFSKQYPARLKRGRQLFLLAAAKILREKVIANAPTIDGVGFYAEDLEIVLVDGMGDIDAVSIIYKNKKRKLDLQVERKNTALLIKPNEGSPKWVGVLAKYQPWPAGMLPQVPESKDAQLIARRVTEKETQDLSHRLIANKRTIETELNSAGLTKKIVLDAGNANSMEVFDDIAFLVLRTEFGYGDTPQPHWRPALKLLSGEFNKLRAAVVKYIETGKEIGFDLPNDYKDVASGELSAYDLSVQEKLAKFI